jgi:hypothetical protein
MRSLRSYDPKPGDLIYVRAHENVDCYFILTVDKNIATCLRKSDFGLRIARIVNLLRGDRVIRDGDEVYVATHELQFKDLSKSS